MSSASSSFVRKYDVFLSFRGEDTRKSLVSHLYRELERQGISTFKDDEKLERGTFITDELFKAIESSKIAVVILSQNYAFSSFCMQELMKIIECSKNGSPSVLPVFYNIDPSDVRKRRGSVRKALEEHRERKVENLETWEKALTEVVNIVGDDFGNWKNESEMIEKILKDVNKILNRSLSNDCSHLVGMETHMEKLLPLLSLESNEEVRMIGICGMGGIGKTTLAKYIYDTFSHRFQAACFMENVKKVHEEKGEGFLQESFLGKILGMNEMPTLIKVDFSCVIESRLRHLKVLVVLDDVVKPDQIDCLARGRHWFGAGSRIMVTCRDKTLVNGQGYHVYDVKCLNSFEASKLFLRYACYAGPMRDWHLLGLVRYAGGLPLALKVWGSYLLGKSTTEWETALVEHKENLPGEIMSVLKVSFDGLEEKAKVIFLYVACFFNENSIDTLERLLKFKHLKHWIGVLASRSLLDVMSKMEVWMNPFSLHLMRLNTLEQRERESVNMHGVLVEMGRNIVCRPDNRSIGKRRFLITVSDVCDVLEGGTGTDKVELIKLNTVEVDGFVIIHKKAFNKMSNLRFLQIGDSQEKLQVEELEYLSPKLVILEWHAYPLRGLPKGFRPNSLVSLIMPQSKVERLWEEGVVSPHLKTIDLSGCLKLKQFPDLSMMPSLEILYLWRCGALVEISCSTEHYKLWKVNLNQCVRMKKFSSWHNMKVLKELELNGCVGLETFGEVSEVFPHLKTIELSGCSNLKQFPDLSMMPNLEHLDLARCSALVEVCVHFKFGEVSKVFSHLKKIQLSGCRNLKQVPDLSMMPNLEYLSLMGCIALIEVSCSIGHSKFGEVSKVFSHLKIINLSDCRNLKQFPDLSMMPSLEYLGLRGCIALVEVSRSTEHFKFGEVSKNMKALSGLHHRFCKVVKKFPVIPKGMAYLNLCGTGIDELPSWIGHLSNLDELNVSFTKIRSISKIIKELKKLKRLILVGCEQIRSLPELPRSLKFVIVSGELSMGGKNTIRLTDDGRCETDNWDWDRLPDVEFKFDDRQVSIGNLQNLLPIGYLKSSFCSMAKHQSLSFHSIKQEKNEVILDTYLWDFECNIRVRPLFVEEGVTEEDCGTILNKVLKESQDAEAPASNERKLEKIKRRGEIESQKDEDR